jgi:hypothetical protein
MATVRANNAGNIRGAQSRFYLIMYDGWFKKTTRAMANQVNREALTAALEDFKLKFIPIRFTKYVERAPWSYPKRHVGFNIRKSRRVDESGGKATPSFDRIKLAVCFGWDPWSNEKPPKEVVRIVKANNPGKFRFSITGAWSGLWAECRRWGKDHIKKAVNDFMGKDFYRPFVQSGDLRKSAVLGKARTTVSKIGIHGVLPIPFPGPRSPYIGPVIRTLSDWELEYIIKSFNRNAEIIAARKYGDVAPSSGG